MMILGLSRVALAEPTKSHYDPNREGERNVVRPLAGEEVLRIKAPTPVDRAAERETALYNK